MMERCRNQCGQYVQHWRGVLILPLLPFALRGLRSPPPLLQQTQLVLVGVNHLRDASDPIPQSVQPECFDVHAIDLDPA